MLRYLILAISVSTVVLGGCFNSPVRPAVGPFYEGITPTEPQQSTQKAVPSGPDARLFVVLSKNTQENVAYLEKQEKFWREGGGNPITLDTIKEAKAAAAEPKFTLNWVATSLKKRFGLVTLGSSLNDPARISSNVTAIADLIYAPWTPEDNNVVADMRIYFLDKDNGLVALARGKEAIEMQSSMSGSEVVAKARQEHQVRVKALEKLDQSLDEILANSGTRNSGGVITYEQCMRQALDLQDATLKVRAMEACRPLNKK